MSSRMRSWFWPAFVFLYPWVFPFGYPQTPLSSNLTHYLFTAMMLFIWLIINHKRLRCLKREDIRELWQHKPVLLALAFGVWVLISSALAPEPVVSLTGNLITLRESALFITLLSLVFAAAYFDYLSGHLKAATVYRAFIWSALAFVAIAFSELYRGQGYFYTTMKPYPVVVFTGPGHLAGFLGMSLAVLGGLSLQLSWLVVLVLLAFGLGLTFNRTAVGAVALTYIVRGALTWKKRLLLIALLAIGVFAGWFAVERLTAEGRRDMVKTDTLEERYTYWNIAWKGIVQRPLTGWGGGQFHAHMAEVAGAQELKTLLFNPDEERDGQVLFSKGNFFLIQYPSGERVGRYLTDWAPHNLFLGIALSWGVVGLSLYLLLLVPGLLPALGGNPAALGVLAYHLFLLLWPPAVEAQGVLWVLWGMAAASGTASPKHETTGVGEAV